MRRPSLQKASYLQRLHALHGPHQFARSPPLRAPTYAAFDMRKLTCQLTLLRTRISCYGSETAYLDVQQVLRLLSPAYTPPLLLPPHPHYLHMIHSPHTLIAELESPAHLTRKSLPNPWLQTGTTTKPTAMTRPTWSATSTMCMVVDRNAHKLI
jgi:hypothetical protein